MDKKERFMEAVAAKVGGKRRPALKRKGGPAVVIAIGTPKMAPKATAKGKPVEDEADEAAEGEGLTCPKCGAELADTPENRKYAAARADEAEDEAEDESESEDEDED